MAPGEPANGGTELDSTRLLRALALAEQSIGLTEPNPRVGCVIGSADGTVLGEGATQRAGGPHAEVMALRDATSRGLSVRGSTAWVTLEPCAHHGRTPPCCDALIEAGIKRVVIGALDPYPKVNGAGVSRLRAAQVCVDMANADIQQACRDINIGFFSRVERGRPWIRVKMASSMDGRTALADGRSQWITSEEARRDGHLWRRRASAVLTGIGTLLADDPRLDVRYVPTAEQPLRIVLDSQWRTPATARILQAPGSALVVGVGQAGASARELELAGAKILALRANSDGLDRVDLALLWQELAMRGVNELHVEAGATLNGALFAGGWADECLLYLAPKLLGSGRPLANMPEAVGADALAAPPAWQWIDSYSVGPDYCLRSRRRVV